MSVGFRVVFAVLFVLAGCGGQPSVRPITKQGARIYTMPQDGRIGVYESIPYAFTTSSYWIEGPEGLVLIDTQFLPSAAADMVDAVEARTGKKVKLAIVLHANPDKFNGVATLQARGIKVVTSKQVLDLIPEVHAKRLKAFYEDHKPDYPKAVPAPESFGDKSMPLSAAGVTVNAHVMGAGCSESHVVVEFEGHVFAGDLVANRNHAWLEIGKSGEWLKRLDELSKLAPKAVYPGRGEPGGIELLAAQREYLVRVGELIAEQHPRLPIPDGAIERLKAKVEAAYPGYGYPYFLYIGLPAEWRRQAQTNPP